MSDGGDRKQQALEWVQALCEPVGFQVTDFSRSFANGLAFCAIMHGLFPAEVPYPTLTPADRRRNFTLAFEVANRCLDVPPILDVEDMVEMERPEPLSVMTYVFEIMRRGKALQAARAEQLEAL